MKAANLGIKLYQVKEDNVLPLGTDGRVEWVARFGLEHAVQQGGTHMCKVVTPKVILKGSSSAGADNTFQTEHNHFIRNNETTKYHYFQFIYAATQSSHTILCSI